MFLAKQIKMHFIQIIILLAVLNACLCANRSDILSLQTNPIVLKFQEYLQIDTSRPENLFLAVEFWRRQAESLPNAEFHVYQPSGKPICVIEILGEDPSLPAIMLNSHMDVVKVEPNDWSYPPFSGYFDVNGDIYGRGAQDTKDVSIQYLEAIRLLQETNTTLKRNVFITLTPDEESGGFEGMKVFVNTEEFASMNIGYALDEGLTRTDNTYLVAYVDKRPWQMRFTTYGVGGHGSSLSSDSAVAKLESLLAAIIEYKITQSAIMESVNETDYGAYTTVNVNILQGGYETNVIPTSTSIVVDMRLATTVDVDEMDDLVASWVNAAGNDTTVQFIRKELTSESVSIDDNNPVWTAIQDVVCDMNSTVTAVVCPAVSDMLYVRAKGIPALGFSTKVNTVNRVHAYDEYLNAETLVNGVSTYAFLIEKLANLS